MGNRILLRGQENGFRRKFSKFSDRRHLVYLRPFPVTRHKVGVTKTKTLENEDLRPKTRLSFRDYEN